MNNKLIAYILTTICITMYSINPVWAKSRELSNNIINTAEKTEKSEITRSAGEINYESTTSSAVEINYESTTSSAIELDFNDNIEEVKSLDAEITGEPYVGNYISVRVTGYDENGSKVELKEDKIQYKWETSEGDILGNEKMLLIDESMDNKSISCQVSYD